MTDQHTGAPKAADPPADHRVVVGVDGSPTSLLALEWAARQAELTGATLEAVAAWEWPTSYGWAMAMPSDYSPADDAQRILDQALAPIRAARPKVVIESRVEEGHPAPLLVEASKGADLLVIGSRGHGEFVGMLLGSVGEHCSTNCHCPVVIIREPAEGAAQQGRA